MPSDAERAACRHLVWERLVAREADLLALCQHLVQIPSVSGEHPEQAVAEAIAAALAAEGLAPALPAYAPGRPNVLAGVGPDGPGVLLVGHLDTVPAGDPAAWSAPPFAAAVRDGRLIGRGACDNKAGIAIGIHVLGAIAAVADRLSGRLTLACVPDEETGATGRLGITPLLRDGFLPPGQAIYTYPGLEQLNIGHRGLIRLRVRALGESTHTGADGWEHGSQGANAVTALAELLLALEAWQPAFTPHSAFPGRRPVITPGTLIHGGEGQSMVPATAEATIDMRLLPGQRWEALEPDLAKMIARVTARRRGVRFAWEKFVDLPAVSIPADTPLVVALAQWTERLTGRRPATVGAGPANEGYLLIEAGIPTVCGFGPPGGNAHAADEYVEVDGLLLTARLYAAAILDLLT